MSHKNNFVVRIFKIYSLSDVQVLKIRGMLIELFRRQKRSPQIIYNNNDVTLKEAKQKNNLIFKIERKYFKISYCLCYTTIFFRRKIV